MGTLSVTENLMFSAALRLPPSYSWAERREKVKKVIEELGLQKVAKSRVCIQLYMFLLYSYSTAMRVYKKIQYEEANQEVNTVQSEAEYCSKHPLSAIFFIHTHIGGALNSIFLILGHLAWSNFLEYPNCCNLCSSRC